MIEYGAAEPSPAEKQLMMQQRAIVSYRQVGENVMSGREITAALLSGLAGNFESAKIAYLEKDFEKIFLLNRKSVHILTALSAYARLPEGEMADEGAKRVSHYLEGRYMHIFSHLARVLNREDAVQKAYDQLILNVKALHQLFAPKNHS